MFAPETALFTVRDHFKVASLDGFGLRDRPAAIGAAGAVLHYLTEQLRRDVSALTRLSFYQSADFMALDPATLRNLEILEPMRRDAPRAASLYGAVNRTVTPMGARRLRDWLSSPLAAAGPILRRRDAVQLWLDSGAALDEFRRELAEVRDLERTLGRLSAGSGNGRDLVALRLALEKIPVLKQVLHAPAGGPPVAPPDALRELPMERDAGPSGASPPSLLEELSAQLAEAPDLLETISRAIVDEPPLALKEGGLIRDGFDAGLDELRLATRGGKEWIAKLQQDEIARTGIASLKVRFNSVFGYYIEVTKSNLDKVPPHYIRKQTMAGGERFITPELKEMEGKILGAEERGDEVGIRIVPAGARTGAGTIAAPCSLPPRRWRNWTRWQPSPRRRASTTIAARKSAGRASCKSARAAIRCWSKTSPGNASCPTTFCWTAPTQQLMLITGPNMAGKSTFIRQVALIVLLAHTGSFVPAAAARIDLVDRIFTRIGASDDLARGQSTFMVEMSETANILNNATPRSLIILDEVGRGTSTFDGLSLAWSIVEHLHNVVGARTLFATHYHELTELAARLPRVKNFNVAVREWNDQIVFLRKIVEGATDKSYGIQVARLAGVPRAVLERRQGNPGQPGAIRADPRGQSPPAHPPSRTGQAEKTRPAPADGFVRMRPTTPSRFWARCILRECVSDGREKGRAGSPLPAAARTECAPYHPSLTPYCKLHFVNLLPGIFLLVWINASDFGHSRTAGEEVLFNHFGAPTLQHRGTALARGIAPPGIDRGMPCG